MIQNYDWEKLGKHEDNPPFPADYQPQQIEIFDQQGRLAVFLPGEQIAWEREQPVEACLFIAIYTDCQLALFVAGNTVYLNRLQNVAIAHSIFAKLQEQ